MLAENVHPKIVQERLGHSSIAITMDIYSHLMPNMQADAAAKVDAALTAAGSAPGGSAAARGGTPTGHHREHCEDDPGTDVGEIAAK